MKIGLEVLKKGNNFLGKEEVTSSNLVIGSSENKEIPQELLLVFKFSVAFAKLITNYSTIRGY
ncbi:MAG: hypothetical protein QNK96_03250 [Flavobacteriia bacterium]